MFLFSNKRKNRRTIRGDIKIWSFWLFLKQFNQLWVKSNILALRII